MLNSELWIVSFLLNFSSPPTAYCRPHLREAGRRGLLAGMAAPDKMSPSKGKERISKFKN
jgi:hypothetical protein